MQEAKNEFVSKLEEIMKAKELKIGRSVAFGKYKQFFPEDSVKHPAKMDPNLLEYLIQNYTKEGETVLDPMAGSYSTCVLASLFGRNAIGVDIEEKFYKWGLEAKERVEKHETIAPKGRIEILKGDARKLSEVLRLVDSVITSPPYAESLEGGSRHTRGGIASRDPALAKSDTYATVMSFGVPVGYSENPLNIGNLKYDRKNGKKETYLEAMYKVYKEMYSVLKPGGKAIVVVKPFIRNFKVIDLPYETYLLLNKVGFKLVDLLKFSLEKMSFWRILYYRKHPEVPVIAHEYILVVEKK